MAIATPLGCVGCVTAWRRVGSCAAHGRGRCVCVLVCVILIVPSCVIRSAIVRGCA